MDHSSHLLHAGFFAPNASMAQCLACGPGEIAQQFAAWNCTQCAPGSFQSNSSGVFCEICSPGRFSASAGQSTCVDCIAGTAAEAVVGAARGPRLHCFAHLITRAQRVAAIAQPGTSLQVTPVQRVMCASQGVIAPHPGLPIALCAHQALYSCNMRPRAA